MCDILITIQLPDFQRFRHKTWEGVINHKHINGILGVLNPQPMYANFN